VAVGYIDGGNRKTTDLSQVTDKPYPMKTSKGVSVKPTWFLKNHPWHANQAKLNKRVPFVLIYHPVFEVAEAIHKIGR
jgi:hypothetical protein